MSLSLAGGGAAGGFVVWPEVKAKAVAICAAALLAAIAIELQVCDHQTPGACDVRASQPSLIGGKAIPAQHGEEAIPDPHGEECRCGPYERYAPVGCTMKCNWEYAPSQHRLEQARGVNVYIINCLQSGQPRRRVGEYPQQLPPARGCTSGAGRCGPQGCTHTAPVAHRPPPSPLVCM